MPLRSLNFTKARAVSITDTAGAVYNYDTSKARIYVDDGGLLIFEGDHTHYHPLGSVSEVIVFWKKEVQH